jgi:hypothetical protein
MTLSYWKAVAWGFSAAGLICWAGCNEVSKHDVNAARDKAQEEQQEVDEARRAANDKIAEQEAHTDEVRREAFRPNYDDQDVADIRHAEEKASEVRREVADEVKEKQKEANRAAEEADKTEARFAAQKARDSYVNDAELQLVKVDEQIAQMKDRDKNLEGAAKEAADERIDLVEKRRDAARNALDDVKSADAMNWELARDDAERALKDLTEALKVE